jgi:hypothetical protein
MKIEFAIIIAYVCIGSVVYFVLTSYNYAMKSQGKRINDDADIVAMMRSVAWPFVLIFYAIMGFFIALSMPFEALDRLAKWFGRNYL